MRLALRMVRSWTVWCEHVLIVRSNMLQVQPLIVSCPAVGDYELAPKNEGAILPFISSAVLSSGRRGGSESRLSTTAILTCVCYTCMKTIVSLCSSIRRPINLIDTAVDHVLCSYTAYGRQVRDMYCTSVYILHTG